MARRGRGQAGCFEIGGIVLDVGTWEVVRDGTPVVLSKTGFKLLRALMRDYPRVVSRRDLERELWDGEPPDSDALRSHLYNLRQAIDRPFGQPVVTTVPGRGYCIRLDSDE